MMREASQSPLIINLAPTGIVPAKSMNPHVPVATGEIVEDVLRCAEIGITTAHLHAREPDQTATSDPARFAPIIEGIRRDPRGRDLILCVTTSGRRVTDPGQRAGVLDLDGAAKPDMGSLTLGSMNFIAEGSMNAPDTIRFLAQRMRERGIKPELEVFDLGMVNFAKILIKEGLLDPPYYFNILLGNVATAQASLLHLATIVADLPPDSLWALAGIGRFQRSMNALGAVLGHGVRTGLEDNIWLDDARKQPASNAELVRRVHTVAASQGRAVASPREGREMLKLRAP
jgi:uncharacterized protein (DUF849 family)